MVICPIFGCSNHQRNQEEHGIQLLRFPKEKVLQDKWILLCKRADTLSVSNARVCSKHFDESDYERDLKSELLNITPKRKKLKPDAVPHLFLPIATTTFSSSGQDKVECMSDHGRQKRAEKRDHRRQADELLKISVFHYDRNSDGNLEIEPESEAGSPLDGIDERPQEELFLLAENKSLREENELLRQQLNEAKSDILRLNEFARILEKKFTVSQQQSS
ncbi:hypothetical protein GE061_000849 [Apolygus lucorum]|uniref:THAP-type domain-containing protein n=1 Tax=Apolygus lucorum TaxID=248454 RepID=A0A8S9Y5H6_APOLU|nr:hypothetical protein GE061_000849 [Apolygus lucorum]